MNIKEFFLQEVDIWKPRKEKVPFAYKPLKYKLIIVLLGILLFLARVFFSRMF